MPPAAKSRSARSAKPLRAKPEQTSSALPTAAELLSRLDNYLHDQWRQLVSLRQLVLERFDDADIHDLRVASRRVRSAIQLLEPFAGPKTVRRLRRPLRRLTRELGCLRNLDEARAYLRGLHDPALQPLIDKLERQRRKEVRLVRDLLEALPCKRLERQLTEASVHLTAHQTTSGHAIVALLAERSLLLYRPIHELLQLDGLGRLAEERHALRIAIKKWRYFNELLAALLKSDRQRLLERLKRYQTLLGDLNDRELLLTLLRNTATLPVEHRAAAEAVVLEEHRRLVRRFGTLLRTAPLHYQFEL